MDEQQRLDKNNAIRQAMIDTHNKRKNQVCKTYKIKIDESSLNCRQKEQLVRTFLEAKWLYNDILNWSNKSENNSPWNYKISNTVIVKTPISFEERPLKTIHSQMKQEILKQICSNIKSLSALSKKGHQISGKLKFKSEVNKVRIKQLQKNFIRRNNKFVKIPGISGDVRVNGLNQIPEGVDFACAELLNTPKGYYLTITTYINKSDIKSQPKISKTIGIDFGCSTSFTMSNGDKISCVIEESERLKRLQKKLSRQVKGSNNYKRTCHLIRVEYQKLSNRKNDLANKLSHEFLKYDTVVIQDEQLRNWHKNHHGKAVQNSVLGRVKSKLINEPNVVVLNRFLPTTKLCTNCGKIHNELHVYDRTFRCECGVCEDRDIHAAKTMVWLNSVGMGRTKFTRAELKLVLNELFNK